MKVNEIFYSLQGEGYWTGTPAVFVRLSGCNLRCSFCDTAHEAGEPLTEAAIVEAVAQYPARHVVITGGEPSLSLTASLVDALHTIGRFVAVETNGTRPLPDNVDWITLSPKDAFERNGMPILTRCDELKVVFDGSEPKTYEGITSTHRCGRCPKECRNHGRLYPLHQDSPHVASLPPNAQDNPNSVATEHFLPHPF